MLQVFAWRCWAWFVQLLGDAAEIAPGKRQIFGILTEQKLTRPLILVIFKRFRKNAPFRVC